MNAITNEIDHVDPEEWERPSMRSALAVRDISRVYRLLQKIGFSQQKIAALTGQSQPEVSAIIHGRKVMAYDVLSRIADGLGVPREYMGLSYEPMPASAGEESSSARPSRAARSEEDDPVHRRDFMGATAAVLVGASPSAYEKWLPRPATPTAPPPVRIGAADITRIRQTTDLLYGLNTQIGGHATLDAISAFMNSTAALLRSSCTDDIGRQLKVALADLHDVAGDALNDVGRHRDASRHHLKALMLARDAGEDEQVAHLLFELGRTYLHQGHAPEALKMFQFGQHAAHDAGSHAELACLRQNEALAQAMLGQPIQVADALGRAEHARSQMIEAPEVSTFHGAARWNAAIRGDGQCYEAWAHMLLAGHPGLSTRSADRALRASEQVLDTKIADTRPAFDRAHDQILFAAALLRSGERANGIAAAHAAVSQVEALRSGVAVDRLRYITDATTPWARTSDTRELRRRIAATHAA